MSCWEMGVEAAWFRRAYLGIGGSTTLLLVLLLEMAARLEGWGGDSL
jgi:hypothetical protein